MTSNPEVITRVFPMLLIILDLGASGVYAVYGNWRLCLYWFAAAVLTVTVTF